VQASLRLQRYEQVRRPLERNSVELVRLEARPNARVSRLFRGHHKALRDATLAVEAVRGVQSEAPISAAWLTSLADGLHLQVRIHCQAVSEDAHLWGWNTNSLTATSPLFVLINAIMKLPPGRVLSGQRRRAWRMSRFEGSNQAHAA